MMNRLTEEKNKEERSGKLKEIKKMESLYNDCYCSHIRNVDSIFTIIIPISNSRA